MKGMSVCPKCGVKFSWKRGSNQVTPTFCSMLCRGHTGFRPGGDFRIKEASEAEKLERLKKSYDKHVIRKDGCWDWKGPKDKGGYPVMSCRAGIGSDRGHRSSWVIHNGKIPEKMFVCHKCDNPICTNPEHLWLGTHKENNDDKISKGRAKYKSPPIMKGSSNPSSRLSEEQITEIKLLIGKGLTSRDIGKQYGVSKTTILRIKTGETWKHIEA